MRCPKTKLISAYLDQEIGLREKTAFEAHVQGCNICSHTLEEMRSLRATFAVAARHPAPYGFATRVMARTAVLEKKKSPWFVPFFIRFAEAAILLIVITVGIVAGKVMSNDTSAAKTANIASFLSLDLFDATPPGTLGGAYLAMTEVRHEK
jgi:anti-sigma factor RsiW